MARGVPKAYSRRSSGLRRVRPSRHASPPVEAVPDTPTEAEVPVEVEDVVEPVKVEEPVEPVEAEKATGPEGPTWSPRMRKAELLQVAQTIGLQITDDQTKAEIITALEGADA